MRDHNWCFVDELEPGDRVTTEEDVDVEVVALDLVRMPSGPCEWRVHTTGPTMRYQVLDRVQKAAA